MYVCNGIYKDVTNQDFLDFFANDIIEKMVLTGKKEDVTELVNKMPSIAVPNKMYQNLGNLQFSDDRRITGDLHKPLFQMAQPMPIWIMMVIWIWS